MSLLILVIFNEKHFQNALVSFNGDFLHRFSLFLLNTTTVSHPLCTIYKKKTCTRKKSKVLWMVIWMYIYYYHCNKCAYMYFHVFLATRTMLMKKKYWLRSRFNVNIISLSFKCNKNWHLDVYWWDVFWLSNLRRTCKLVEFIKLLKRMSKGNKMALLMQYMWLTTRANIDFVICWWKKKR